MKRLSKPISAIATVFEKKYYTFENIKKTRI